MFCVLFLFPLFRLFIFKHCSVTFAFKSVSYISKWFICAPQFLTCPNFTIIEFKLFCNLLCKVYRKIGESTFITAPWETTQISINGRISKDLSVTQGNIKEKIKKDKLPLNASTWTNFRSFKEAGRLYHSDCRYGLKRGRIECFRDNGAVLYHNLSVTLQINM